MRCCIALLSLSKDAILCGFLYIFKYFHRYCLLFQYSTITFANVHHFHEFGAFLRLYAFFALHNICLLAHILNINVLLCSALSLSAFVIFLPSWDMTHNYLHLDISGDQRWFTFVYHSWSLRYHFPIPALFCFLCSYDLQMI